MKGLALILLLVLFGSQAASAAEPTAAAEAFMNALYKRLAKTRNAVLLDAPVENGAVLGSLYMYQEPKCYMPASNVIKKGIPISLAPYFSEIDVSGSARTLREPKQIGSYSLNRGFAAEIVADMKKNGFVDGSVETGALINALTESKLSFRVVRTEVDFLLLHKLIRERNVDLTALPDEYEGIVVPIAHFSIADFSYEKNRASQIAAKFGLDANFLNEFLSKLGVEFSAKRTRLSNEQIEIDTSVTFAFKPNVLMSRHAKCPRW